MINKDTLLSMVIIGRNDNYTEDYLYRISNTLCFLASNLAALQRLDQMEVVVVDWGSEIPLSEVLDLTSEAIEISRFVNISEQLTQSVSPGSVFHSTRAVNVGIRRSVGRYAMLADTDSLMPLNSLRSLLDLLEGKTDSPIPIERAYLHIRRYQIPWQIAWRRPSIRMWSRCCTLLASSLQVETTAAAASCLGGFAAAQLLHRDLWEELRGYDESLEQTWGWCDNDLSLRLSSKYPSIDLVLFGVYSMHVEHLPKKASTAVADVKMANPMRVNSKLQVNDENWGLWEHSDITTEVAYRKKRDLRDLSKESSVKKLQGAFSAKLNDDKLYSEDLRAKIEKFVGNSAYSLATIEQMILLAVYAMQARPVNLYWIGRLSVNCLLPALMASRGIECYLLNIWNDGIKEPTDENNPGAFSGELVRAGYRGHARILLGEIVKSIDQIHNDSYGFNSIELAYVSDDLGESEFSQALTKVFASLAVGGAIIVSRNLVSSSKENAESATLSSWYEERPSSIICYEMNTKDFVDKIIHDLLIRNKNVKIFSLSSRNTLLIVKV